MNRKKLSVKNRVKELLQIAQSQLELSEHMLTKLRDEFSAIKLNDSTEKQLQDLILQHSQWDFAAYLNRDRVHDLKQILDAFGEDEK